MAILEVKDVTVYHKKIVGIKNASFEAKKQEIIGFIGADGSGKSSLMHALAGVIKFSGEIIYDGYSYHSPKEAEKIKNKIGLMPQGLGLVLYRDLTIKEHLDFFTLIRGLRDDEKLREYKKRLLHMAGLLEFQDRLAGNLSGGMMQKLSLICTLLHRPKFLILDEPTTGVDPLSRMELWNILKNIKDEEESTIIISTGYMQEAGKCDRLLLFDSKEIIAKGDADTLLELARDYTYEETKCTDECFSFNGYTYSIKPLNAPHKEPALESLYFINTLKRDKNIPEIEVSTRENIVEIPPIIMEAKGVTKRFGKFTANDHIDMVLKRGEILGLLGANGAGKTTFIKMLLGLLPIDEGELYLLGKLIKSGKDRQELKNKIGYVSQHFALYKDMSVRENLIYFANLHNLPPAKTIKKIDKFSTELGFKKYLDSLAADLPLGIKQRFSVAVALLHEPVVLFLDEPTSGVDVVARAQFWKMLKLLKERWQISILITTHYMSEAEFCDRVVVLKRGKKIVDDSVKNLHEKNPEANSFEEIFLKYYGVNQ